MAEDPTPDRPAGSESSRSVSQTAFRPSPVGGDDFVLNPPKRDALSAFHHPNAVRGVRPKLAAALVARAQLEV
jgi:hypothetical protein